MKEERRESVLWLTAAALCVAVVLLAVCGAPELAPVTVVYSDGGVEETAAASGERTAALPADQINLNTADRETLMKLDGVGNVLAGRIVEYRETHGGFDSVEELLQVEGVGEKRLAAWREKLTV